MKNNKRINYLLALAIITISFAACHSKTLVEEEAVLPNIIYILADDLGYGDVSVNGQEKFQTPNIDKLAEQGMRFTQHYSGSTVCAPSRSCLMTGQHTGHTFIRGNIGVKPEGQFPLEEKAVTVAEVLKEAGYVTGAFGKWGLGNVESEGNPNKQGFDEFYGYICQTLGHNYYPYYLWHNDTKILLDENAGTKKGVYAPELIHEKALKFIEDNKDTAFFMYYPTIIPHAELVAPEKYMEKFRGKYDPEVAYKGADEGHPRYKMGGYGSQNECHAAFAAMVNLLDVQVEEIRSKLEEFGLADNTLIIFTSDNGPHHEGGADPDYFNSNGDYTGYKRDLYEGGIRMPFIATWPGKIAENTTSDHISAFWDFLPTVCDLLGIKTPEHIDGISYLPTLMGEEQAEHKYLYWEFQEQGGKQAVRLGKWKGVRLNMSSNSTAPIELYNLETDITEQNDIANEHPEIIAQISEIMDTAHVKSDYFPFEFEKNDK